MHLPAACDQLCRPPSLHPCACLPFSLACCPALSSPALSTPRNPALPQMPGAGMRAAYACAALPLDGRSWSDSLESCDSMPADCFWESM